MDMEFINMLRGIMKSEPNDETALFRIEEAIDRVAMADDVRSCTECDLARTCKQKTPGIGPMPADIMFVGEQPGENEQEQGVPFVGPSGQLLDKIIASVGWKRQDIYLTNVVKCRTDENNRNPTKAEIAQCFVHLRREIEIVKPKIVVCWGSVAASTLIHPDFKITKEQGIWFEHNGIYYMGCYHPAYLLRLSHNKSKEYEAKMAVWRAVKEIKRLQSNGYVLQYT